MLTLTLDIKRAGPEIRELAQSCGYFGEDNLKMTLKRTKANIEECKIGP